MTMELLSFVVLLNVLEKSNAETGSDVEIT